MSNTHDKDNAQLVTDANKAFYALTAAEYDKLGRGMVVDVAQTNAANILARVPGIDAASTELMDFAAGTGLLAMFVAPRCKSVTAVDQSEAMVDQLRQKLAAQQDPANRISNIVPVVTDILADQPSEIAGQQFDVVTCTMAYHHLSDPARVTQVLAGYLRPGGHLAIVDLVKTATSAQLPAPRTKRNQDGSHSQIFEPGNEVSAHSHGHDHGPSQGHSHDHSHDHSHKHEDTHSHENVIAHHGGFSQAEMEAFFSAAGLQLVDMDKSAHFVKDGKTYDIFLAIARKPL